MFLFILQVLLGVVTLMIVYYFIFVWNPNYFKNMGVPGPYPWPLFGQLREMMKKGLLKSDTDWAKQYGRVFGIFEGNTPVLLVRDPDMLQNVAIKCFHAFTNRRAIKSDEHLIDLQLTALKDDHWRHVRHLCVPALSQSQLKAATTGINDCAKVLVKNFEQALETSSKIDVKGHTGAFTMDVIARTAFGIEIDSQLNKDNPFVVHAHKTMNQNFFRPAVLIGFFFPVFKPLLRYFDVSLFPPDSRIFFREAIDKIIQGRLDGDSKHGVDFLQLMMNAHKEKQDDKTYAPKSGNWEGKGLTREELEAQAILFLLGGYDTTASAMAFFLHSMAVNPDCQERLHKEIENAFGDKTFIDFDTVSSLDYLERCLQETLRMYPPGIRVDRVANEDITINGLDIPKGCTVAIQIYQVHHDPQLWPDPEKFDPDRFTPEAKASHHPMQYIPFGAGPRICLGMRLAQIESKVAITHLIRNFRFSRCEETEVPIVFNNGSLLQPLNGITLKVEKRK